MRVVVTSQNGGDKAQYRGGARSDNPRDEHVLDLHLRANMKTVDIRRKKQILTCMWRNINKGILETAKPIRQNRSAGAPNIYLPIPITVLFKKSVFYFGATLWNALPALVRLCADIDSFKLDINKIFYNCTLNFAQNHYISFSQHCTFVLCDVL